MVQRFLDHYYRRRPVNATFTGVHEFDDRLPDWSPDGLEALVAEMRMLRRERAAATAGRAAAIASPDRPSPNAESWSTRVDGDLADAFLELQIEETTGTHFQRRNPALYTGEAVFGVLALLTRDFAPLAARMEHVRARLDGIAPLLASARQTVTGDVPELWQARALRECAAAEAFLADALPAFISEHGLTSQKDDELLRRAREAFAACRTWLAHDVGVALLSEPAGCGEPLFDLLLRRGHGGHEPMAELRQQARDELDHARAALESRARALDPGGWPAVEARLASDHPDADGYLAAFAREWRSCRDAAVAADLVSWPDWPLRYVPLPPHTRDLAPSLYYLCYRSPAPFDTSVEPESVVTPIGPGLPEAERAKRLRASNRSVIRLNHVAHHGGLGHHVQNHFAYRSASHIGRIAAVDCASRIGMFSGGTLAEGWAIYAVDLMEEIGWLSPAEQVAAQHTRVRLAARAVLDIGLHADGWPCDRATRFWQDSAGATRAAATSEVTRASMFPGTAIMYWLGVRAIQALRRDWMRQQGAGATLRAFHDRLLSYGSIPVSIIRGLMLG